MTLYSYVDLILNQMGSEVLIILILIMALYRPLYVALVHQKCGMNPALNFMTVLFVNSFVFCMLDCQSWCDT